MNNNVTTNYHILLMTKSLLWVPALHQAFSLLRLLLAVVTKAAMWWYLRTRLCSHFTMIPTRILCQKAIHGCGSCTKPSGSAISASFTGTQPFFNCTCSTQRLTENGAADSLSPTKQEERSPLVDWWQMMKQWDPIQLQIRN